MRYYILPISALVFTVSVIAFMLFSNASPAVGSVIMGGEYQATQINGVGTTTARTRFGTLGSIVVSNAGSAGVLAFYATTSISATSTADLIFSFDSAAVEGTYTYDVAFGGGLLIDHGGFNGDIVVTTR